MTTQGSPLGDGNWFLALFVGGWIAINLLLSIMSGWIALARKYRATSAVEGARFSMASGSMGYRWFPVSYRSCLRVTVGAEGFGLSVFFLFRPFTPPLFLPWAAVEKVREERVLLSKGIRIYLHDHGGALWFFGKAGKAILETHAQFASKAA